MGKTGGRTQGHGRGDRSIEENRVRRIAIIDLPRLGTRSGYSEELVAEALGHGVSLHVGGGITEKNFEVLEKMGVAGALVDPFTPIIADIIESPEGSAAATVTAMPTRLRTPSGSSTSNSI